MFERICWSYRESRLNTGNLLSVGNNKNFLDVNFRILSPQYKKRGGGIYVKRRTLQV